MLAAGPAGPRTQRTIVRAYRTKHLTKVGREVLACLHLRLNAEYGEHDPLREDR